MVPPEARVVTDVYRRRMEILTADLDADDPRRTLAADHKFLQPLGNYLDSEEIEIPEAEAEEIEDGVAFYFYEKLEDCYTHSWEQSEAPVIYDWIESNTEQLEVVCEAASLPKFWCPAVPMEQSVPSGAAPSLIESDLSEIQKMRECARCLLARAMLKLGDGDVAGCQSDLITVRRIGRLLTQRGSMVQCLVGIAIQRMAAYGEAAMLESGLSAGQIDDYRKLVDGLPAGGNIARSIDVDERTMGLSAIQQQHEMGQNLDLNLASS